VTERKSPPREVSVNYSLTPDDERETIKCHDGLRHPTAVVLY
jgi:hypothetical protein